MAGWGRRLLLTLACLAALAGWLSDAGAHRRHGGALSRPSPDPAPASPEVKRETTPALTPEAYWQRLGAQEKTGEVRELRETVLALVNLFPRTPQRGMALFKLAEQERLRGASPNSLELYGLAASLGSGTPLAGQARLAAATLEFSLELLTHDPVQALSRFLTKVQGLPPGYAPEALQGALSSGWLAVGRQLRGAGPCPLPLLEELLALWDLQPEGAVPEEGALLLADLLQERGLYEEARALLGKVKAHPDLPRQSRLPGRSLDLAWLSQGWLGVAEILKQYPGEEGEAKSLFCTRLAGQQSSGQHTTDLAPGAPVNPGEALLAWFLPQQAHAGASEKQVPALEQALRHSWPAPLAERLQGELAQRYWSRGDFPQAARVYQVMVEKSAIPGITPFYRDRLGLSRWREGQTDAAQAAFQVLEQEGDPFWQHLARVRLADLEVARLQTASSP